MSLLPVGLLLSSMTLSSTLKCYKDEQLLLADKTVSHGKVKRTVRTASPFEFCMVALYYNGSHQKVERDIWPLDRLPMECGAFSAHCFPTQKVQDEWEGFGCCCKEDLCNRDDEAVRMFFPFFSSRFVLFLRALLYWFAQMTVPIWLTILITVIYCRIMKALNKEIVYEWDEVVDKNEKKEQISDPADSLYGSVRGRKKDEARQPLLLEEMLRTPPVSARQQQLARKNPSLILRTSQIFQTNSAEDRITLDDTPSDRSIALPDRTQSDSKVKAPTLPRLPIKGIQQEKPKDVILPNGRVQKASMNFDEMTDDDDWD